MEGWKFWWGIAAFFLGGLATQLNGWLTYRRQRMDRREDAANALVQRREEFELQHLVEVNQLLHSLMDGLLHLAAANHLEERYAFDEDDLGERLTSAQQTVSTAEAGLSAQVGFILDDEVRALVRKAMEAIDSAEVGALTGDLGNLGGLGAEVNRAYDALSRRVRQLYIGLGRASTGS